MNDPFKEDFAAPISSAIKLRISKLDIDDIRADRHRNKKKEKKWSHGELSQHHCRLCSDKVKEQCHSARSRTHLLRRRINLSHKDLNFATI